MGYGRPARTTLTLLAALVAACGGDADRGAADAGRDVGGDASPTGRSYLLGVRAEGYRVDQARQRVLSLEAAGDPARYEAVVVPLDLLGIPWDAFTGPDNSPTELPAAWLAAVREMEAIAEASDKPIALALSPLNRQVDTLAPRASDQSGVLVLSEQWEARCYDPTTAPDPALYRDRYAGFVVWAVKRFQPRWVYLAQRVNRYEECSEAAYEGVLGFAEEAHDRLQALEIPPTTVVTVDVEDLYGYTKRTLSCAVQGPAACFAERRGLLEPIEADRLGLESRPAPVLADLDEIPAGWLTDVADARPDLPALVAGTSLPAVELRGQPGGVGPCQPSLVSSEVRQRAWLDQVLAAAAGHDMELVVWHPLRDLLEAEVVASCPCAGDQAVCNHLEDELGGGADEVRRFVTGGLWAADDTPRLGAAVWEGVLAP